LDAIQKAELISKVQISTPETLALVGEYADVVEEIGHVSKRLKKVMKLDTREEIVGLCGLHHQVLLTYAANLAFYFYLRATPAYASNPKKLASHGVIDRLSKLKNGLQILDSFGFAADDDDDELSEEDSESMEGDEDEENRDPSAQFLFRPSLMGAVDEDDDISLGSLEEDELRQLDREEMESEAAAKANRPAAHEPVERVEKKRKEKKPKQKKVAAPLASVAIIQDDEDELGASKKRKKGSSKPSAAATTTDAEAYSAFGEPTQLAASDSADKEARRRSLKFYTGQIDAKDARKAGGSGLGGDSDIPYRDRERSRMAVADANARKSATFNRQADRRLNGDEWGEEDSRDWKDVMDVQRSDGGKRGGEEELDDTDYYDLVASGKKSAKRAKKDEYDELKAAQRVAPDNSLEEGEHRGISRTIEKNRGLTPRRPKANRNPRVKKRIRFEKAQKKLSSKGPVYKGGQGALQGGYSGEQSGINSNVVKSRQFA
jgi:U3 small nucleolar RNA-associated protein 3